MSAYKQIERKSRDFDIELARRSADLADCPFCKDTGALQLVAGTSLVWATCGGCDCCGPTGNTIEEAVTLWNSRNPIP